MAGCGDVLSLEDLQTAKKHQIFEAEVITGKAGGVAGGATIGTATNPVTGQTQQTLPSILADLGFDVQSWTSSTGGVLASANQVFLNDTSGSLGLGDYYAWGGPFEKTVPAGTDPALPTSGYIMRSSRLAGVQAREALRRIYAGVGLNLVAGSFEAGGALVNVNDVLLQESTGKAFSGPAGTVAAGTNPASGGFVVAGQAKSSLSAAGIGVVGGAATSAADCVLMQLLFDYAYRAGVPVDCSTQSGQPVYVVQLLHAWTNIKIKNLSLARNMYCQTMTDYARSTLINLYGGVKIYGFDLDDRNHAANPPIAVFPDTTTPNQTVYMSVYADYRSGSKLIGPDGITDTTLADPWNEIFGGNFARGCGTFAGGGKGKYLRTHDINFGQYNDHAVYVSADDVGGAVKYGYVEILGGSVTVPSGARSNGMFKYRGSNMGTMKVNGVSVDAPTDHLIDIGGTSNNGATTIEMLDVEGKVRAIVQGNCASTFNIRSDEQKITLIGSSYDVSVGGFDAKNVGIVNITFNGGFIRGETSYSSLFNTDGGLTYAGVNRYNPSGMNITVNLGDVFSYGGTVFGGAALAVDCGRVGTNVDTKNFVVDGTTFNAPNLKLISNNTGANHNLLESHNISLTGLNGRFSQSTNMFGAGIASYTGPNQITYDQTFKASAAGPDGPLRKLFKPANTGNGAVFASGSVASAGNFQDGVGLNLGTVSVAGSVYTVTFNVPAPSDRYTLLFAQPYTSYTKTVNGFTVTFPAAIAFQFACTR